jgi:hypothetical protein
MPLDSPQHMPEDMDELDSMVARAYSQGIDTGRKAGRRDTIEAIKEFFLREFNLSKGRRRRADPNDPKTAAILAVWEKFNAKLEDGSLWR